MEAMTKLVTGLSGKAAPEATDTAFGLHLRTQELVAVVNFIAPLGMNLTADLQDAPSKTVRTRVCEKSGRDRDSLKKPFKCETPAEAAAHAMNDVCLATVAGRLRDEICHDIVFCWILDSATSKVAAIESTWARSLREILNGFCHFLSQQQLEGPAPLMPELRSLILRCMRLSRSLQTRFFFNVPGSGSRLPSKETMSRLASASGTVGRGHSDLSQSCEPDSWWHRHFKRRADKEPCCSIMLCNSKVQGVFGSIGDGAKGQPPISPATLSGSRLFSV